MRVIDRIDINYFRSVYSISLTNCRDVNVITGSNDSGKSNILKALNLFFNGETEPHEDLDFLRDLNRDREHEARAAKGRMTIWMRVHFNNFLKWESLPDQFTIKRSWNRYSDTPVDSFPDAIPPTTIGRFLNKIKYHYIPAVRSREIFSDLLAEMHDTLVQDESRGLRRSSEVLVQELHEITEAMSKDILDRLKIESTINIPESLEEFFRALDFSTKFGDYEIPLILRGDGIQSRHLPFILNYIATRSKQHHIWGYEEPENSLELSRAFEMKSDFEGEFSKENQIFVTTHSPAFYDITGPRAAKWYIENRREDGRTASKSEVITSTSAVDKTMGLLAVITPRMREVYDEFSTLKETVEEMQGRLAMAECPLAYVEGPSDVTILTHAQQALAFDDLNIRFESSGGAGNLTQFLKATARVKCDDRPLLGIFDADARGRREFDIFRNYHRLEETEFRAVDRKRRVYVGALETPAHLAEAEAAYNAIGMVLPLSIEFMFPRLVIEEAIEAGVLELVPRQARIASDELPLEVNVDTVIQGRVEDRFIYLAKRVTDESKVRFANWVIQKDAEIFESFRPLFENVLRAVAPLE